MSNEQLADDIKQMLMDLTPDDVADLPSDEVKRMMERANPYGRVIDAEPNLLSFSITQISHKYWQKLITSAMVAFLNRMNDEWKVPEGVPVVSVYEYLENPSLLDTPQAVLDKGYQRSIDEYKFNREWMAKRVAVKEFLEEMFQFNPIEHVRSAYRPCRGDTTRKPITTNAGLLAVEHLNKTDPEFRNSEELYASKVPQYRTKIVRKQTTDPTTGKTKTVLCKVRELVEETEPLVTTSPDKLGDDLKDPTCAGTLREFLPPHDIYARFNNYLDSNYEQLRDFVRDAYCEKPQIEFMVCPHAVHKNEDEAARFQKKHANSVITSIYTATFGKWNICDASFKEIRESVNFYNENTVVLEEMMRQLKKDEMLGRDLMKKRVEKTKRKNIAEDGPDSESFRKYISENKEMQQLGAEYLGGQADDDIPDDAVQVDVWQIAKGGTEVIPSKFYSASEAPSFVTEAKEKARVDSVLGK